MSESLGAIMIADERSRQVEVEGFASWMDDGYTKLELVDAACAYANAAAMLQEGGDFDLLKDNKPYAYPWRASTWNPSKDPIRNLVKAGALIAAEIDRLIRAKKNGKEEAES